MGLNNFLSYSHFSKFHWVAYGTVILLLGCENVTCRRMLSRGATWSRAAPRVLRVARYTTMQLDKFVTREGLTCRLSLMCLRYFMSRSREYFVRDFHFHFGARITQATEPNGTWKICCTSGKRLKATLKYFFSLSLFCEVNHIHLASNTAVKEKRELRAWS